MAKPRGRLTAATVMAMLLLTACVGGSNSSGDDAGAGRSASSSTSEPASASASHQQLVAFAQALGPIQVDYAAAARTYKQDVLDKSVEDALVDAQKLEQICVSAARLAPSGDDQVDANWPLFASECKAGWTLIIEAFQNKDRSLLSPAHAHFDQGARHLRTVSLRLLALGVSPT